MYCTSCGTAHAAGATVCPKCGQAIRSFPAPPAIRNHLVAAIFTTLCCCMPFGIVALVYSAQVNTKLAAGDVAGAQAASDSARTWTLVAFLAGLLTFGASALLSLLDK